MFLHTHITQVAQSVTRLAKLVGELQRRHNRLSNDVLHLASSSLKGFKLYGGRLDAIEDRLDSDEQHLRDAVTAIQAVVECEMRLHALENPAPTEPAPEPSDPLLMGLVDAAVAWNVERTIAAGHALAAAVTAYLAEQGD